ncbi:spermidine/putrescine ABC transporter ATP-binding protein [Phaeobacter gallaeciensis]|uniref:Spermidine/putrescine ABC transporter ATP-binding protein n=2 Tax=Roseobacteraceae TaxID=2854170 RepID=A0A366WYU8_9RHOB|nr:MULTISPECIES: ABC transporter ATP-binding protein [Roseobacteraceae]MBT3141008.1 ABC transporter ATP-binding protein [Falsiruegeria litorea]MBT8168101.1 ABC transporter ATP-binding protein [Falsiruegeria litorea]RBW56144.1 spermidine/putrescine ABC transporter ATP-binding protein [Phaeobacter gallaeciensis]
MAEVSVKNVTKKFGNFTALDDVSMEFPDGGFFALLGPSGSGKTTLLRTIAGFLFADSGSIHIGNKSVDLIPVEKREIGMMFQNYALFPNMTIADNVGFGLRVRKVSSDEERRRIGEALELVQLSTLGDRKPHQLSGGQRQRVALARAIVTNPRVLLLDEPLSALDKSLRVDMQVELKRIQHEIGITTIFVTHDQEEALTLSDKIGILREGRMIQSGPPRSVYNNPVDRFTAEFLGDANIVAENDGNGRLNVSGNPSIKIPKGAETASALAVRPESLSISATEPKQEGLSKVHGRLVQRMFAGAMSTCIVQCGSHTYKMVARDQDVPNLSEGENIWLSWKSAQTIVIP